MMKLAITLLSSFLAGGFIYAASMSSVLAQSAEGGEAEVVAGETATPEKSGLTVRIPESPEEIMFGVRLPKKLEGSEEGKSLLKNRVEQILGRCGAGAGGDRDVFVIEPTINETNRNTSEGLVRNVSSLTGELSLTARHRYSDAVFYSAVVPLNAAVAERDLDPLLILAKAIKPTDAAYVRFVRNARKNAFDYGSIHPEIYEVPDAPADTVVLIVPVVVGNVSPYK